MESLILKWKQYHKDTGETEEIPINELSYEQLVKALKINSKRMRPYKKLVNLEKALRQELDRRRDLAKRLAQEQLGPDAEILAVMSEKELFEKAEELKKVAGDSKLVTIRFT